MRKKLVTIKSFRHYLQMNITLRKYGAPFVFLVCLLKAIIEFGPLDFFSMKCNKCIYMIISMVFTSVTSCADRERADNDS